MEIVDLSNLFFYDVLLLKKVDATLCHIVYRKPTDMNRYLKVNLQ